MPGIPAIQVFLASTVWAYIKIVATAIYVYKLWQAKKKAESQSPTYGFDITTQCSNELPIPVVYGTVKSGGNIVWQNARENQIKIGAFMAFNEGKSS